MRFFCKILPHPHYIALATSRNGTMQKLRCVRCGRLFGINHDVRVVLPWDSALEALMREDQRHA